ncbi:MAG TPA: SagB family peptide dehydrogenase [Vicinamibacterales bacterium]|nr:SagB family peptide dehydrogenase [Vicinamibacterales bacterium]
MPFDAIDDLLRTAPGDAVWESFHENSKLSRHERHSIFALPPSDATVVRAMNRLLTVKPYRDRAKLALPARPPASAAAFEDIAQRRMTARRFDGGSIDLAQLATILHFSYGITRDNTDTGFPRPFRAVPSGGALYPLNVYVYAARVRGADPGLYHFDPEARNLDVLWQRDDLGTIARFLFQPDLAATAAAVLFVSATFLRSTFKYSDRGYRFALIEAGHLGQNALLSAEAQGLAAAPIGGYLDRDVDRYLHLDGLNESVIYMLLLGGTPTPAVVPAADADA